jgi:uncharacterized membrane protein (DUF485 family)
MVAMQIGNTKFAALVAQATSIAQWVMLTVKTLKYFFQFITLIVHFCN